MMKYLFSAKLAKLAAAAIATWLVAGTMVSVSARAAERPIAVVELFTSQGCSSCPAADKILAEYAERKDVLALSFHVDYWNYLGWKDTFSRAEFTERQRRYAASFRRHGVYTPQAVVNGRTHAVGSRKKDIEALINEYVRNGKSLTVAVNARREDENVRVTTDADSGDATLWVVYYDKKIARVFCYCCRRGWQKVGQKGNVCRGCRGNSGVLCDAQFDKGLYCAMWHV